MVQLLQKPNGSFTAPPPRLLDLAESSDESI
jgi:hypothetical protein